MPHQTAFAFVYDPVIFEFWRGITSVNTIGCQLLRGMVSALSAPAHSPTPAQELPFQDAHLSTCFPFRTSLLTQTHVFHVGPWPLHLPIPSPPMTHPPYMLQSHRTPQLFNTFQCALFGFILILIFLNRRARLFFLKAHPFTSADPCSQNNATGVGRTQRMLAGTRHGITSLNVL